MSRPYRLQGENCLYNITSRGNGRQKIFISDYDYRQFLHYLLRGKEKYSFYLYAFVLMSNHYHLLLETTQPNLASAEIGGHFGLSYSSVSKAAGSLEKQMYEDKGLQKEIDDIISHIKG